MSVINPTPIELMLSYDIRRCSLKGCLDDAWWTPVMGLSYNAEYYVWQNFGNMLFCDWHKEQVGLEDLVFKPTNNGVPGFVRIQQAFRKMNLTIPVKEFTILKWRMA